MPSSSASESLTIGRLARAADVGVETIRYYQGRDLLPVPPSEGAFRYYPLSLVERIRFIKRAQELGFSPPQQNLWGDSGSGRRPKL